MPVQGGILWVAAVSLIIWTGLFLYMWRLDRKVSALEEKEGER